MYNNEQLLNAIWNNPGKLLGLEFTPHGREWQSRQRLYTKTVSEKRNRTTLKRKDSGLITFYSNGSEAAELNGRTIVQVVAALNNLNERDAEVWHIMAEAYGIEQEPGSATYKRPTYYTDEKAAKIAAAIVTAELSNPRNGRVIDYLKARGLEPSERLGAYSATIRDRIAARLQLDLQIQPAEATQILRRLFSAAGYDYANDYGLIIPYYHGTRLLGFYLRNTTGEETPANKHRFTYDMAKAGYCHKITKGQPVYMVEGLLDAEALLQAGFVNVWALGGQTPSGTQDKPMSNQVENLLRMGAKELVYIPDYEHENKDGSGPVRHDATVRTITAFLDKLTAEENGSSFVALEIAPLCMEANGPAKLDANNAYQQYGADGLAELIEANGMAWYCWQLRNAAEELADRPRMMVAEAQRIYASIANAIDRQIVRDYLKKQPAEWLTTLVNAGFTSEALKYQEKAAHTTDYYAEMGTMADKLAAAVKAGESPEYINKILGKVQRTQRRDEIASLMAQVNVTPAQMRYKVASRPDPIKTSWQLWNDRNKPAKAVRYISFSPANVSIVGAPTSNGKTLFMLQAAIQIAQRERKQYLFISLENDQEQLYLRALACYIGDNGGFPADVKNPRAALREWLKGNCNNAAHADYYTQKETEYLDNVAPFLKLVRLSRDAEAICSGIQTMYEYWSDNNQEPGGVWLDYLQLMRYDGKAYSRTDELKAICDRLNDTAKETTLPIICGAQLNRTATANNGDSVDKWTLANLGESSGIEFIAEDVYFMFKVDRLPVDSVCTLDATGHASKWNLGKRTRRMFALDSIGQVQGNSFEEALRRNCIYVESMKARDYETGCYCLLPTNFATGSITGNDSEY